MAFLKIVSLLVAMVTTGVVVDGLGEICKKTSDVLSFSHKNADMDMVRIGKAEIITCCANNFVGNVTWFREDQVGNWTPFSPSSNNYVFGERSQVLAINGVSMSDNGTYICMASDQSHNVTFRFTLDVIECEKAAGKITPMKIPPKVKYAAVGDTLTLECRGYFGCGMEFLKPAFWQLTLDDGTLIKYYEENTSNHFYSVTPISQLNGAILGSQLTFKHVTEDNFTYTYTCVLSLPETNVQSFTVTLKRKSTTWGKPHWLLVTVICVVSILGVSLLLLALAYPWRSQGIFYVKTKLNCGCSTRPGNVMYDVCLVSSQESAPFVTDNIYEVLCHYGYSVFYHYEADGEGRSDACVQMEGLVQSSHVLLFLSSEEEVERIRQFFVESCVNLHGGSKIIIVHKGPLRQSLKDLRPQIQAKLKIVKTIEWPRNDDENSRGMNNFWCSVRLRLPVPGTTTTRQPQRSISEIHDTHASPSSAQPFLENGNPNVGGDDA